MKTAHGIAKSYGLLTAEERFRLILAASGRGDECERERLVRAGSWITFSVRDHTPYARAFHEVALSVFLELLELAARYFDAVVNADDREWESTAEDTEECSVPKRSLELADVAGFLLRTKGAGWRRFCERLHVPAFLVWEELPGWQRLQRGLALAEASPCGSKDILHWLNRARPAGETEWTGVPLTEEAVATAIESMFRSRIEWWGG